MPHLRAHQDHAWAANRRMIQVLSVSVSSCERHATMRQSLTMTQHYPLGSFAAEARVTAWSSLVSVRNATQLTRLKTARHGISTSPQWDQHESSRMSGGQVVMTTVRRGL